MASPDAPGRFGRGSHRRAGGFQFRGQYPKGLLQMRPTGLFCLRDNLKPLRCRAGEQASPDLTEKRWRQKPIGESIGLGAGYRAQIGTRQTKRLTSLTTAQELSRRPGWRRQSEARQDRAPVQVATVVAAWNGRPGLHPQSLAPRAYLLFRHCGWAVGSQRSRQPANAMAAATKDFPPLADRATVNDDA